jgi:alpha-galactosidase
MRLGRFPTVFVVLGGFLGCSPGSGTMSAGTGTPAGEGGADGSGRGGTTHGGGGSLAAGGMAGGGGINGTGGISATGGISGMGGISATGGISGMGGNSGTGTGGTGAIAGTGGIGGTQGGANTGGTSSSGGAAGAGGAKSTGTGGTGGQTNTTGGGGSGSNVLAATPPMGWNSWNDFACNINDGDIRAMADAMASNGMSDVGYQYVNIDDCWADHRDGSGTIVPGSNFPDMKALADYVHGKGLKLGIYSDRGTKTCAGRPGSQGHETQDANTYAAWGIDYLKYDNCSADGNTMQADYTTMGKALKASGRSIVFSICAWTFQAWMPSVGQLWRTTTDIKATWASITSNLDDNATLAQYAGPGHWNDPDMLEVGNGGLSDAQNRAHFGLWALIAAPLIAGNDLRNMSAATKAILTADEVIAIDQDPLGIQGTPVKNQAGLEVWKKKLTGTNTVAVGLLNRSNAAADISVAWTDVGLPAGSATVRDVYAKSDLGAFTNTYTAKAVPVDALVLLKITSE